MKEFVDRLFRQCLLNDKYTGKDRREPSTIEKKSNVEDEVLNVFHLQTFEMSFTSLFFYNKQLSSIPTYSKVCSNLYSHNTILNVLILTYLLTSTFVIFVRDFTKLFIQNTIKPQEWPQMQRFKQVVVQTSVIKPITCNVLCSFQYTNNILINQTAKIS